ncbi:hypothetical protein IFM89_029769 [Coptis chinensis]|uniref:Pentatricopeptide repeat-containing protein n=1 Tax=Coptis chinensis TaxID=261450 RepID=A0A835IH97_9MAGN|nr:hypothetical protein IFM89_029769 [Coptis chinensis]
MGHLIHNTVIKTGFESNLFVANSLILFYGQLGKLESIRFLFDEMPVRNIVTWTAVISAFSQNHKFDSAIGYFREMQIEGVKPNSFTMATLLPSFCNSEELIQIHSFLIKCGFDCDVFVSTALIDVYAKCGSIFPAQQVFNEMPERNIVSWNAMMLGYNQNGGALVSLELFAKMRRSRNVQPDSFSVVTALNSCSVLTTLRNGKEIHGYVYKVGLEGVVFIGNGLIDMYGKCGLLEVAERVFYEMRERDVSSWTALITCYGLHGQGAKAISIFEEMKQTKSITPNSVTITAILTACSHSCLVEDGIRYFEAMTSDFGIEPTMKHYSCIVDLLGRTGFLEEALKFIAKMPIQADVRLWESLLGTAVIQGDKSIAEIAAKSLITLQSENPEVLIQLANVYAKFGRWEEVAKIRVVLCKTPGLSFDFQVCALSCWSWSPTPFNASAFLAANAGYCSHSLCLVSEQSDEERATIRPVSLGLANLGVDFGSVVECQDPG